MLEQRALYFPIKIGVPWLARHVLGVAAHLAQNDFLEAERSIVALDRIAAEEAEGVCARLPHEEGQVTPALRARALTRVLRDLATNGWGVLLEAGQVYVRAPRWRTSATGLSIEEVQREKQRARASMAARVDEQIQSPAVRKFITDQERLHYGVEGPRSARALIADGPALAEALRQRGPAAIQPYLQVAEARRDDHTGLRLWDIYRYFRYYWSFPFYSTPGRTLPLLVRDAGQPNHPVCGLLCLASPVPKLSARDSALGLTPAWLEAVVVALDAATEAPREDLAEYVARLAVQSDDIDGGRLVADLCVLLNLPSGDVRATARALEGLSHAQRRARAAGARRRIINDLVNEVEAAIRAISVDDLGFTHAQVLKAPGRFIDSLREESVSARRAWHGSRSLRAANTPRRRRDARDMDRDALRDFSRDPLFRKKRVAQLAALLRAWEDLAPLRQSAGAGVVRAAVTGSAKPSLELSGGTSVSGALRCALQQRLSRLMASQVADVSVCGAIPPYNALLGGKLTALLAMSREVASRYFDQYDRQVSDIGSKMAGRAVTRPAELLTLTTTSFFSVGSSQYNRVRLPDSLGGTRWEHVGESAGHGTMHFSLETTDLLHQLLQVETGRVLITSEFGEGPSERMRKVRDGLARLGLPAAEMLMHGMSRRVYLAELSAHETRPGLGTRSAAWHRCGPRTEDVAEFWRERWLRPRLERQPEILADLRAFRRDDVLLSRRFADGARPLTLLSGGTE